MMVNFCGFKQYCHAQAIKAVSKISDKRIWKRAHNLVKP
jgi:hypothetical protein